MPKVEIELPEFEDYEYTGEYRRLRSMDYFVTEDNLPGYIQYNPELEGIVVNAKKYHILRKKTWKPELDSHYYYIDSDMSLTRRLYTASPRDKDLIKANNYFKSYEEAKVASYEIETLLRGLKTN